MDFNPEAAAVGLDYWLQWQVPVCALIFTIPSIISLNLVIKERRRDDQQLLKSSDLWLPCWRNLHPLWLLLYRAFAFSSMVYLLYQTVESFGSFVFFFYTQWTFVLVLVYFAIGIIISARGCWIYSKKTVVQNSERDKFLKKESEKSEYESSTIIKGKEKLQIDQPAEFLENLMQSIYHACAGAVMLTDIVFWCILLPLMSGENFSLTMLIGLMHSANVIFLLLDAAFNSLPFPWYRLTYFVLWSFSYIVFQWISHAFGVRWWPYPFLELSTPWAPAWYFGLALFHIPCYGLYALLIKAKDSIFKRMFPRAFVRVSGEKQT